MKNSIILFALIWTTVTGLSQTSEKKSGVQYLNISRKSNESNIPASGKKAVNDIKSPAISIISPVLAVDSVYKNSSTTLTVTGKAEDKLGIFEVLINGTEARLLPDGTFIADIPQEVGRNLVIIKATNVSLVSSRIRFYTVRFADETNNQHFTASIKKINNYSIDFISPAVDNLLVATDNINLKACVKASAPIKKILIYRNNLVLKGFLANQITQGGNCDYMMDFPLSLKLGINEIKIEVFSAADTVYKILTLDYSLYAARNFALLIGNENYDDPSIMDLSEPLQDVSELNKILTNDYNFDPSNVIILRNPTKAEIIGTLHQLRSQVQSTDNFLIFYAGHGFWDEGMEIGYWLPRNASKTNPADWIPNTDLTNYLNAIKTKHTLLIAGSILDEPAKTLKAGTHGVPGGENMIQYPDGTLRYFTVRESARLQSFPDDYVFYCSWGKAMYQLGNAVPIDLAFLLAKSIRVSLSNCQA